jgi:hypothetical protein
MALRGRSISGSIYEMVLTRSSQIVAQNQVLVVVASPFLMLMVIS